VSGAEGRSAAKGSRRPHAEGPARPAGCVIVTVSDTRGPKTDRSGDAAARLLEAAGHRVVARSYSPDEIAPIRRAVKAAVAKRGVDVVVLTGGTGVAPRDRTPQAVEPLLDYLLPGFGEWFRALSIEEIGPAGWNSRAGAGVLRRRLVVYLPGSPGAVALGVGRVLIPELHHLLHVLGREA
jgi:molybdopterin adenylyltransferase